MLKISNGVNIMGFKMVPGFGRRALLRAGAGAAASGAAFLRPAPAAEQAIGTWPDGVSGSTAFIGISLPRTGTYAIQGEDELKGYLLAIEHINDGNELIRRMAPRITKGASGNNRVA
ncbi:MAG: hypothetical protein JOY66_18890 [Acetobacteraceae bacterium]|nr:hypothetical protein [Acetobacteraceae bacterium]